MIEALEDDSVAYCIHAVRNGTNVEDIMSPGDIPEGQWFGDETHPLVIAGGHAAFNPEAISMFIDGAVLGDGEQAVLAITDIIAAFKSEGSPGGRDELLMRVAKSGVMYVPAFYDVEYLEDGRIRRVSPNRPVEVRILLLQLVILGLLLID